MLYQFLIFQVLQPAKDIIRTASALLQKIKDYLNKNLSEKTW